MQIACGKYTLFGHINYIGVFSFSDIEVHQTLKKFKTFNAWYTSGLRVPGNSGKVREYHEI